MRSRPYNRKPTRQIWKLGVVCSSHCRDTPATNTSNTCVSTLFFMKSCRPSSIRTPPIRWSITGWRMILQAHFFRGGNTPVCQNVGPIFSTNTRTQSQPVLTPASRHWWSLITTKTPHNQGIMTYNGPTWSISHYPPNKKHNCPIIFNYHPPHRCGKWMPLLISSSAQPHMCVYSLAVPVPRFPDPSVISTTTKIAS